MHSHTRLQTLKNQKNNLQLIELSPEESCHVYDHEAQGRHPYGHDWWKNPDCPFAYKYLSIDSLYPPQYFGPETWHPDVARAQEIYTYMQQTYHQVFGRPFKSILELGTGAGEITCQFHQANLDYIAVEGTTSGVAHLVGNGIQESRIIKSNLKFFEPLGRKFDLVMCTEVAEHIEPFFASKVVDNCIRHGDAVWFSGADRIWHPHYHHCNEQPIEVWDNLFAHMGFSYSIPLNRLHQRADRIYFSKQLGEMLQLPSQARDHFSS